MLPYLFANQKPPEQAVWNRNLKRWAVAAGLSEKGMSSNVARKSICSWIILDEIPLIVV